MEVDSKTSTEAVSAQISDDDEIEVLACYRIGPEFPPQLVAGRRMTTEITQCLNDLSLPEDVFAE